MIECSVCRQIAVQVAVVFAKVARIDYPRQWQSIFADLIALMQSGSTVTVRRVYLVLHHILKELSSKRLTSDQKNFADVRDFADWVLSAGVSFSANLFLHHVGAIMWQLCADR